MTDCAAPRHDEPVEAETHAHLCGPCRRGLSRDLRRLPSLHADLEHLLATTGSHGHGDGTGLPFNDPASECRSQIRHDLTHWCQRITHIRELDAPPPMQGDHWAASPVAAMCGWLHGQVTWCTFRDWAGDMAGAITDNANQARRLIDPYVTKEFEIPGADGLCLACGTGRMVATIYASDGDRRRPQLACQLCGETLAPEQWLRYGERVIQRREAVA